MFVSIGYSLALYVKTNTNNTLTQLLYYTNPFFFTNPTSVTYTNLHSVDHYGLNFASYISFVLVWIGAQTTVLIMYTYALNDNRAFNWDMALMKRLHGKMPPATQSIADTHTQ